MVKEKEEEENIDTTDASPVDVEETGTIANVLAAAAAVPEKPIEKRAQTDKQKKKRKTFKPSFKRNLSKDIGVSDEKGDEHVKDAVDTESDTAGKDVEDRAGQIESMLSDLDDDTSEIANKPSADVIESIPLPDNEEKKDEHESDDDNSIAYFSEEEDDNHSYGSFSVHDIDGVPDNATEDDQGSAVANDDNVDDAEPKAEIDFDDMLDNGLIVSAAAAAGDDEEYDPNKNQLNMFLEDADEEFYKNADNDELSVASSSQNRIKGKIGNALKRSGSGSPRKSMRIPSVKGVSVKNVSVPTVSVPKPPKPSKPSKLLNRMTSKGSKSGKKKPSKKYAQLDGEGLEDDDDVSILSERTSTAGSIARSDSNGALDMSAVDDESVATRDSDVPIMLDPFATPASSSRKINAEEAEKEKQPVKDLFAKQSPSTQAPAKENGGGKEPVEDLFANQQAASTFSEMRAADEAFAGGFPDVSSSEGATDAFGFFNSEKTEETDEKAKDTEEEEEDPFVSFEPFGSAILDEEDAKNALDDFASFAQFVPARAASFEAEGEKSDVPNVGSF